MYLPLLLSKSHGTKKRGDRKRRVVLFFVPTSAKGKAETLFLLFRGKTKHSFGFLFEGGKPPISSEGGGEKGWQKQSCNHFALIGCEISLKRWGNLYLRVLREFFWLNLQVQYSIIRIHNKYHILYLDLRCASIHRSSVEVRFYSPAVNDSFSTFQWGPRFLYLRGKIFLFIIDKHRCLKNWNLNQNLDLSKISLLPAISGTGSSEFLLAFSRYLPPQPKFWK